MKYAVQGKISCRLSWYWRKLYSVLGIYIYFFRHFWYMRKYNCTCAMCLSITFICRCLLTYQTETARQIQHTSRSASVAPLMDTPTMMPIECTSVIVLYACVYSYHVHNNYCWVSTCKIRWLGFIKRWKGLIPTSTLRKCFAWHCVYIDECVQM